MGQLPAIGAEVPQDLHPPLPAIGAEVPQTPPIFRSSNELDAEGHSVVRDTVEGVGKAWHWLNTPLLPQIQQAADAIADHLDAPRLDRSEFEAQVRGFAAGALHGAGGVAAGFSSPLGIALTLAGLGPESSIVKRVPGLQSLLELPAVRTLQRAVQGTAGAGMAAHGAGQVVTGESATDKFLGVAEAAAGLAGVATAARTPNAAAAVPGGSRLTPTEQLSNTFADVHGIPLDAATATGSRFLRAAEKRVANSMGGEGTADRLISQQQQGLARTGAQLADQAHPDMVKPEQAGQGVRDAMTGLLKDLHKQAGAEYDKLRAFEADPEYATRVERTKTGREQQAVEASQRESLGRVPSARELAELRRIHAELESLPYVSRTFTETPRGAASPGNAGHYDIAAGSGGAPVYHDIVSEMPGSASPTREVLRDQIGTALETGNYRSDGAKAALEIASKRLAGDKSLSPPSLPASAGEARARTELMGLAVDVRDVKQAVRPLYDALKREAALVPLMGDKAKALTALDRLVNGPDHAPLSAADGALSDLKAMARVDMPELRTTGQGLAAKAVKDLDGAVRTTAAKAGPEVLEALEMGRSATKGKYEVADVLEQVRDEPVRAFQQMTAPKDTGIALLRQVRDLAPEQMQAVGRAKLEQWLDLATERGRFEHADKLYAEWQKLGPETKAILYGRELTGELDKFFLLAKRVAENPNPSGTAHTLAALNLGSAPVTWSLAKVLYTPRGVRALTRLLEVQSKGPTIGASKPGAAQQAAVIDVLTAARVAGLNVPLPAAAMSGADQTQPPK